LEKLVLLLLRAGGEVIVKSSGVVFAQMFDAYRTFRHDQGVTVTNIDTEEFTNMCVSAPEWIPNF
jgi:hypothetical protein